MEGIIVALIAITPTMLATIINAIRDKKKLGLDTVKKDLDDSIKDLKVCIENNNKESLKRYLVYMLSRAKFNKDFEFNEYEKSIIEESYKIYRAELGNGYVKELYTDCKRMGKL